ncbi:unnamed protein product [Moneuplotes crassus]|uniref:Cyclic nucleotide-binding domain-containing protein n=1 Tax=Euplotes crassus TaxID=5936 RepID=A0AAD1UG05_EUPCR|nr:unnamed protein product [Moneuplotes crassus]
MRKETKVNPSKSRFAPTRCISPFMDRRMVEENEIALVQTHCKRGSQKRSKCCKLCSIMCCKCKPIYPNNKYKIKWDILIICLIIWNCTYTPFQFSYLNNTPSIVLIEIFERVFDLLFLIDFYINFRTVYFLSSTGEPVVNPKSIALNYLCSLRFIIDLSASIPIELLLIYTSESSKEFGFLRLLKLAKLFRFGKLLAYLTVESKIKLSFKIGEILFFLILATHWCNCYWYSIVRIEQTWIPPKDQDNDGTVLYTENNVFSEYFLIYYYSLTSLIGADLLPSTFTELYSGILLYILGPIMFGILIGNFSNILYDFTKAERESMEVLDMITQTMFSLRLPIDMQNRVSDFFDIVTQSRMEYNKKAFKSLNHALSNKILVTQCSNTFSQFWEKGTPQERNIRKIAGYLEISHFQMGDIILKQGEKGGKVFFIIDGLTEILLENEDFQYYQQKNVDNFYVRNSVTSRASADKNSVNWRKKDTVREVKDINVDDEDSFQNLFKDDKGYQNESEDWSDISQMSDRKTKSKENSNNHEDNQSQLSEGAEQVLHEFENFKVVNECQEGDFFGEISCITKYLPVTCTVRAVKTTCCGVIGKKHASLVKDIIYQRMYSYKDANFQNWHKTIKNIPLLKRLQFDSCRTLCLHFKRVRFPKGTVLLNFGEINPNTFFLTKGEVGVYVHNKLGKREQLGDEIDICEAKFQHLKESASFNFVCSYLEHESLFTIKVEEDAEIMLLHRSDLIEISLVDIELLHILDRVSTKYQYTGCKYDYYVHRNLLRQRQAEEVKEDPRKPPIPCFNSTNLDKKTTINGQSYV